MAREVRNQERSERGVADRPGRATRAGAERPAWRTQTHGSFRHWPSWILRFLLALLLGYQLLQHNREGASVAAMGLAVCFLPPLISTFSSWHVPRLLDFTFVLAMALQYGSESLKLFEIFTYWDKLVHPAELFLATGLATFLLLGYRHIHHLEMPDGLAAAGAMLFGMTLGASWELLEFALDWFGNANLQKSIADTMTDILTNDAGAIFGTLLAFWLYRHRTTETQKVNLGKVADWLTGRLAQLFAEHGIQVGAVVALAILALMGAGWLMDRQPIPRPPHDPGQPSARRFESPDDLSATTPLRGAWQLEPGGLCRVNSDQPLPGSEQMGLLALEPGASYGLDTYQVSARFYLERPPLGAGTAMEAGLAFGIRGPDDFYLLSASVLHDELRLQRYIHGRRRDLREERLRFRGEEWHTLRLEHGNGAVTAYFDDRPIFEEQNLVETDGGLGLWARVTRSACFSGAAIQTGTQVVSPG